MKTKWQILALMLICSAFLFGFIQLSKSQDSITSVNIVPAQTSIQIGQTLNVNLTIYNVQNLYALDITLDWNSTVLQLKTVSITLGVNSHPEGVLYGNQASDNIVPGDVYVNVSQTTGEYHLVATSVAPADSFNGSGTVATLSFNVLNNGSSLLTLQSDLADHPEVGETTSEPIDHINVNGSVNVGAVPEFPQIIVLTLLVVFATVFLFLYKRTLKRTTS
jgi:hypothetical protein